MSSPISRVGQRHQEQRVREFFDWLNDGPEPEWDGAIDDDPRDYTPDGHAQWQIPGFATVRVFVDPTNIYVAATNGNAMGLALAATFGLDGVSDDGEPLGHDGKGLVEVDLLPAQCRAIVSLFKEGAVDGEDDEPGAELRIEVNDHEVTITDASGLLEGQSLTLPRPPTADNAAAVIVSAQHRNTTGATPRASTPPRYYAASLALVIKASKVYAHDLLFEHQAPRDDTRSGSTLVRCGESFLALMQDSWKTEEDLANETRWRDAWTDRLGPLKDLALEVTSNDSTTTLKAV